MRLAVLRGGRSIFYRVEMSVVEVLGMRDIRFLDHNLW